MTAIQTAALPQLPAAVTIEASVGIFGAPCIRVGVNPRLSDRDELMENKELIYWLVSTSLMREQANLADFERDYSAMRDRNDGKLVDLGISLFSSLVGDCEVNIQIDVPSVSSAHLRRAFDRVFNSMLDQVDAVRPYAQGEQT